MSRTPPFILSLKSQNILKGHCLSVSVVETAHQSVEPFVSGSRTLWLVKVDSELEENDVRQNVVCILDRGCIHLNLVEHSIGGMKSKNLIWLIFDIKEISFAYQTVCSFISNTRSLLIIKIFGYMFYTCILGNSYISHIHNHTQYHMPQWSLVWLYENKMK